eukprot:Skav207939  [mRNA]  locus=scaffold108:149194:149781:+ [translate_table: standard]
MYRLHDCYQTIGELFQGLAGAWHTRDPLQLTFQDQCRAVARELISGQDIERSHFRFGYEFIAPKVLEIKHRDIFVVRYEHLWDDYSRIDSLLGGRGVRPLEAHLKNFSAKADSSTLDSPGRTALCQLLCREIYYYKVLLLASRNLNSTEVQQSWDELELNCRGTSLAPPYISQRFSTTPALSAFREFGFCTYETV